MTQEEKDLVLIDVCGRLPYDIKIKDEYGDCIIVNIHNANIEHLIDRVVSGLDKMVLRPLSSMTEEERKEYHNLCYEEEREEREFGEWVIRVYYHDTIESIDWLNAHHFDYRGLIPKGLALEATEDEYDD